MDEVTHLPDSLQKLLKVTVGMEWPEGNEAGLRAISQAWSEFSQQLQELDRELTTSAEQVSGAMDGDAADAFRRQVGHRIPEALDQLQQQAEQFASESKNAAADIQKTKIMVVTMLTVLAATIAELIASLFGSVLIPGVVAAARVGIGALFRELAAKLAETGIKDVGKMALTAGRSGDRALAAQGAKNLGKAGAVVGKDAAKYAAGGAAFMGGMDLGIQGAQDAAGERDGIDWSSVEHSVVGGAIGGGAFGVGRSVGRAFSSANRSGLEKVPGEQRELVKPGMHVFGTLGYAGMQVGGAVLSTPLINLATGQSTWAMAGAGALSAASRMGRSGTETGAGASAAEAAATGESIKDKLVSDGPSENAGGGAAAGESGAGGSGAGASGADGRGAGASGAPVSTTSGNPRGEASPTGSGSSEGERASTPPPAYSFMGDGAPVGTGAPHVPDLAGANLAGAGHSPQGQAPFGGEPVQHQVIGGAGGPVGAGFTSPSAGHGGPAAVEPAVAHSAADGGGASLSSFLGGRDGSGSALPTTDGAPVEHGSNTPEAPAAAHTDPGLSAGAPHGDTGAEFSARSGLSPDATPQEPAGATPETAPPETGAPETAPPETAAPQTAAGPPASPAVSPQRGAPSSAPAPGGATPPPVAPRPSAGTSTPGGTDASHGPATSSPGTGSGAPPRAHQPQTTSGAPSRADASTPGTPDRSAGSAPAERPSTTSGRSAAGSLSPSPATPPESARSPENADSGAGRDAGDQRPEPSGRWDYVPGADASSSRWVWAPAGPVRPGPLSAGDGPRVVSRANFVEPDHGVVYADQRFPGVSRVNARAFAENRPGHRTNCADAMVQIENARRFPDRAIRGAFRAGPSEPITLRELLNRGVIRDHRFATDFDEVESHVLGLPHGARVPVFFVHEDGSMGHFLLAENREGVLHYLDNAETVIGGRWPAKHLVYGRFPEGGELPPVRSGFAQDGAAQDGSAAPGPDAARGAEAPDVPGGSGPHRPESTHEVEFERGSKELSPQQRGELDAFVDDLVHRGRAARRAGEPLPEVTVTGRGNGSRMPWAGSDAAHRTARERANAVRSAVRERLAERLDNRALPRSDLRSDDFRITARSAGADHGRAESDSGRAAQVALHTTGPQMIVGHAGHDAEPVPRELHMNWFGDRKPLAGPLGEQIRAWQEKAGRSGWRLHLWVDDRAAARNAEYLAELSDVQVHNVRDVLPRDSGLPRDTGEATGIPPAAVDTFHYALDRGAYNLSSDVARYAILHQRGGVYLDVDLAPGELELPQEPVRMSQDGIPFLAPEIRDENQAAAARTNLADADPEHWAGRTPTDQDVVDWQYRGGNLTNNLIISPRGSSFLHGLLGQLPDVDTLRGQASDLRRNAAHLTGPHRVQRHLEQHLRDRGLHGRLVEEFRSGRAAVDPDLVHQWAHRLQWVTDESGDQLHDEHETASTSRTDAGSAAGSESDVDRESGSPRASEPARAAEPGDFDVPRFGGSLRDPGPSEQGAAVGDDAATGADGRPQWLVEATRQPWSNMADVAPFLQMEPAEPHGGLAPVQEHDGQSPGDGRGPVPEYTPDPRSRVHEGVPWDEVTAESDRLPAYSESPPSSEPARSEDGDPRDVPGGSRPDSSDEDEVFRDAPEHPPAEEPAMSSTLTDFGSWSQDQPAYAVDEPGPSSRYGSAERSPVADVTAFVDSHPPSLYSGRARGPVGPTRGAAGAAGRPAGDAAMRHGRREAAARRGDPGSRSAPGWRGDAVNVPDPAARPWIHPAAPLVRRNGTYEFSTQHVVRAPLIDRSGREVGATYHDELFASRQHQRAGFHDRFTAGGGSVSHTAPWGRSAPTNRRYVRNFPPTAGGRLPSYDELYGPPERALDTRDPFSLGRAFGEEGTNPEDAWEPTPPYSETLGAHDARRILGGRAEAGRNDGTEPGGRPSPAESQPHPTRTDRGPARSNYRLLRGNRPDHSGDSNVRGWGGELPRAAAGEQHPIPEGAVARGSFADDGEADRVFARHYADVLGVNADRFWRRLEGHARNCFASLVATSQTLATGRTVAARPGDRTAVADAERYFGDRFRYSSLEQITGHMRRQDPGAQGAVFLQRRDGTGHYVLVHTRAQTDEHGRVVTDERNEPRRKADFVDGHRGSFADLRGVEAVAFMPIRKSGTEPLPEAGAAPAEDGAGLRGSLGGGHGSSRLAQDRERRIRDRYGIPVGSQYGEHSLSSSVLGRLERVLDALPESHLRDNPSLRGIVRSRERGSASAYFPETETIEISHPFGMPGRMYVALDRGVDWQLSTMDQSVIRSDEGANARRDAELGLRHGDRHVMGGVSRVLAHGNLVEWTLRHEIGHSVDRAAAWAAVRSHEPRFGGWRFEGFSANARHNLARTILRHAGLPDTAMGLVDRSGRSTVQESLAAAVQPDSARSNDVVRLPREFEHHGRQVHGAVERAVRFVRVAASSPWMFDDGRARDLTIGDRIYQIDSMGRWTSYLAAARRHALSNYQFSARDEWFAEAYAAHHDPDPRPRTRLDPAVRDWFDRDLPEALTARTEQSGRVRGWGGEPSRAETEHGDASAPHQPAGRDASSAEPSPGRVDGDPLDVPGGAPPSRSQRAWHRDHLDRPDPDRRGQRAGRLDPRSAPRVLRPVQRWDAEAAEEAATGRRRHLDPVSGLLVHDGVIHPDVHFAFDPRAAQGWELYDRDLRDRHRRLVGVCFTDADAYRSAQRWALAPRRGSYVWRTAPGEKVPTPLSLSTRAHVGLHPRVPAPGSEDFGRHPEGPIEVVTHGSSSRSLTVVNVPAGARLADGRQLQRDTNVAVDDRSFLRILDHSEAFRAAYRSRPEMSLRWFICFMGGRAGTPDVIGELYREYGYGNRVNVVNTLSGRRGSDAQFGFRHGDMMTTDNGGFSSWRPGRSGEPVEDEDVARATTYSPEEVRAIGYAEGNPEWANYGWYADPGNPAGFSGGYSGFGAGRPDGGALLGGTAAPSGARPPGWQHVPAGSDSAHFVHEPSPVSLREVPTVSASLFRGDDAAMLGFMRAGFPHLVGLNRGAVGSRDPRWRTNCADATVQGVRAVLSGRHVRPALPTDPVHYARMEESLGSKYAVWPSYAAVAGHMWRQRPGTTGTLLTFHGDAMGHYLLARRRENDVVFLDAQSERPADLGAVPQFLLFQQVHEGHYPSDLNTAEPWEESARIRGLPSPHGAGPRDGAAVRGNGQGRARAEERRQAPREPAPPEDAQHDPAALARRARTDGAEFVGTLDGRRIRAAIDRLTDSAGPELRELIEHAFSDRNLTAQLSPRARDGAYAVDFTPGGTRGGPRIAVELTGLRRRGDHAPGTADFGGSRERAGHVSTAASQRAHVGSDSFSTRIPTPIGVFMAKILGLVDRSEGGLSVTREHAASTTVTERDVPATAGEYDATYRVTVSKPGRAPWSRTTTRTDYVDASAPVAWPRETGGSAEHRLDFRAHDPAAVEGLEFSGLGEVTSAVSGELGLRQHEERELRAWLDRLGSEARLGKDVFADGAHETFHFRGRATKMRIFGWRRRTRVRVFVADGARVRALPDVDGEVEHRESARTATTATQSKTRRRGFGAGALFGDFTGTTAAAAGPVVEERGSTRNASGVTDEHERETVATYAGPLAKRRADVTFLVEVGDAHREAEARPFVRFDPAKRAHVLTKVRRYEPKNLVKVDGGVTMWMRPHRADELGWSQTAAAAEAGSEAGAGSPRHPGAAPPEGAQRPASEAGRTGGEGGAVARTDPANDPAGATRHDVPDRTDARTRIPQRTAEACAGAVLHELAARGHVPARELPALKKRLLDFLAAQENAGEITSGGDGALFELSALVPKAPDVFLSAEVDRPGAEYLGVAEERFSGAIRSAHENDVEITKAREASRGLAAYGVSGHEYPVGQATFETGTEHTQRIGQQLGHEQPFPADQRPHRYRYPVSLRARIGGSLVRDSGPDVAVLGPIRGSVEVTASELPGIRASTRNGPSAAERGADASTSAEGAGGDVRYAATRWYDGEPPPDASAFAVPTGAEAASHKPIPHQVRTAADMLGGDERPRGWRRWSKWPLKPLVGAEPPRFHEHRGSRLSHPRDGAAQERNPALPGLVGFGTRAAREAGAGLAESFRDSRTLLSHNRGGLLGSRDASGRVELDTRTSNPRVVSGPVEHTFTRTSHAQTDPGTGARKTRAGELSGSTMRLESFSNWLFFGNRPVIDLAARLSRTTGKTTDDVSRTTTTTRHTERSYVLRTDETHVLRTSRRHNWQDPFSAHHRGPENTAAKWIRVPDNDMWVPASELPAIPGLTEADLAHLHPEDAARYREAHPVAEHRPAPDSDDRAREPDAALRPPDDVGRGSGRVELHRTAAVRDLVRGIEHRLDQWSREHGRPNPGRRLLDLAHEAVGKPPTSRPERVAKFDAISARLVHDVLGPAVAPRRFDAALDEMLNGGRSVYLEGETAFGKVEQLVVLRARLGPGEHHRTVPSEVSTTEHGTTRRVTEHDQRGQTAFMKLGISPFPGVTGKPASLALPGVFARFRRTTGTDRFHEHRENVTTTREGPAAQFLHDLTVEMEVYPYARPGTYTRLLGTWAPALVPRRFGQPWRAEFPLGPGAVRSTVSRDEALPVDEDPTPPLDRAEGSLRQQQVAERGRSGFSADAQVRARPMPASRLREVLRGLAFGDPRGGSSWPGLRPRAAHQLLAATSSGQLGSHLRRELSDSGYVVPLVGDRLEQVSLSLDAHRWELLDVLDEATIHRATTRVDGGKPVSERGWEVGFANAVDFREMNVGDAPIRPDQLVSGMSRTVGEWTRRHEHEISTAHPDQSAQQRRYVVRLHPRWRITPTWRGKKVPEEWQRTVHVDEDDPIVLDVDRAGLDELGLRVPEGREAAGPEGREPGERAEPQDARSDGEVVDDPLQDWLVYEQHLIGDPGSARTSAAASGEPAQERASLSNFLRGSGGTAAADGRDTAGPG